MILEYVKLAFRDLGGNKLRTFLSLIGIVIGVAVVYAIFSISDIAEYSITSQLMGGNGVVTLTYVEDTSDEDSKTRSQMMSFFGMTGGKLNYRFSNDDLNELKSIEGIEDTFPNYSVFADVRFEQEHTNLQVKRYTESFLNFYDYEVISGNDLSDYDQTNRMSAVLVDAQFVDAFTDDSYDSIVGKTLKVKQRVFTIVGVVKNSTTSMNSLLLMDSIAYDTIYSRGTMSTISIKIKPGYDLDIVNQQATDYLNHKYGTEDNYQVQDLSMILDQITSITGILSTVMGIIAFISLVVAGIGVMNIMFVSVVERTREIGVKRAIGASKKAIQFQFIVEACSLTLLGGLLGVLVGIGIIEIALNLLNYSVPINVNYIYIAIVFSISLGFVFGYLPAKRAANLNIIEAIATE